MIKNLMKGHKQDYIVILLAATLVVIVFGIVYVSFTEKSPTQTVTLPPTPSPTQQSNNLPIQYDNAAEDRLAQIINTRPTLAPADTQQKTTTLTSILHGINSGVLYETDNVRIEYVQSVDLFMAEIKTQNIVQAKAEANIWFLKQGFSQQGICKLPVMFYLNPEVSQELQGQAVIFSPLPTSC